jgi:hypothetical protein
MAKQKIPPDIQSAAEAIIANFNSEFPASSMQYVPRFKGMYLYLDRSNYGEKPHPICRLEFTATIDHWKFAIYKYSKDYYDPDEWVFPGRGHLNGSIEGAMRCGLEAYPVRTPFMRRPGANYLQ